jgi:hypothetical protein
MEQSIRVALLCRQASASQWEATHEIHRREWQDTKAAISLFAVL